MRHSGTALQFARLEDLGVVEVLGRGRIGADHVPQAVLERRVSRQAECVGLRRDHQGDLIAVSVVYALTRSATEAIESGQIVSGAMLDLPDLASSGEAASLYIAAVASVPGCGSTALALLWQHLAGTFAAHGAIDGIFARAATASGARLLERSRFTRLEPPSEIWARRIDTGMRNALGRGGEIDATAIAALLG